MADPYKIIFGPVKTDALERISTFVNKGKITLPIYNPAATSGLFGSPSFEESDGENYYILACALRAIFQHDRDGPNISNEGRGLNFSTLKREVLVPKIPEDERVAAARRNYNTLLLEFVEGLERVFAFDPAYADRPAADRMEEMLSLCRYTATLISHKAWYPEKEAGDVVEVVSVSGKGGFDEKLWPAGEVDRFVFSRLSAEGWGFVEGFHQKSMRAADTRFYFAMVTRTVGGATIRLCRGYAMVVIVGVAAPSYRNLSDEQMRLIREDLRAARTYAEQIAVKKKIGDVNLDAVLFRLLREHPEHLRASLLPLAESTLSYKNSPEVRDAVLRERGGLALVRASDPALADEFVRWPNLRVEAHVWEEFAKHWGAPGHELQHFYALHTIIADKAGRAIVQRATEDLYGDGGGVLAAINVQPIALSFWHDKLGFAVLRPLAFGWEGSAFTVVDPDPARERPHAADVDRSFFM